MFKRIGADRRIKRCFLWFQVYLCMLKFGRSCAASQTYSRSDGLGAPQITSSLSLSRFNWSSSYLHKRVPRCVFGSSRFDHSSLTFSTSQRWLTIAALPVTLIILIIGYHAIKREHRGTFYVFGAGCALGCAYFVYKVSNISL